VAPRRRSEPVRRAVALIARRGRVLMERRSGPLLAGLWEPPGVELANGTPAARALQAALGRLGVRTRLERTPHTVRHVITHRSITAEIWNGAMIGAAPRRADLRWVDPSHPAVPLTALARKLTLRRDQPPFR
jgi:adenine-specific DNA glycosylase